MLARMLCHYLLFRRRMTPTGPDPYSEFGRLRIITQRIDGYVTTFPWLGARIDTNAQNLTIVYPAIAAVLAQHVLFDRDVRFRRKWRHEEALREAPGPHDHVQRRPQHEDLSVPGRDPRSQLEWRRAGIFLCQQHCQES